MSSSSSTAYEAPTTGKPKQTKLSNFQEFLDEEELCPARKSREMVKRKIDMCNSIGNFLIKYFFNYSKLLTYIPS